MKRFFTLLTIVLLTSCSIGLHVASSHGGRHDGGHGGKQESATLSFTSKDKMRVQVQIDNKTYNVETAKDNKQAHGKGGKHGGDKSSSKNSITLPAGSHNVRVKAKGREIYNKRVELRPSEHKEVRLN